MATDLQTSSSPVEPGTLIAGKYRVERVIASGGMGVVLAAKHDTLGNTVAVKVMLPNAVVVDGASDRFLREARAAAHLSSEHVVRVFDVGKLDSGLPFMVMEMLQGSDLAGILEERGPLPVAEAAGYVVQALDGLIEAHRHGIVHRDLKPSNLFVSERGGRLKILDFGISKLLSQDGPISSADAVRTSTQALMGSPTYMSPEQVKSAKNVDLSTDIWSMGVILFELLTGKMVFWAESYGEIFARILTERVPLVTEIRPDVPADLAAVIARCIDRDREKRPTAAELRVLLAPFAADGIAPTSMPRPSLSKSPPSAKPSASSVASAATLAASVHDSPAVRAAASSAARPNSRTQIGLAIGVLVIALGAAVAFLSRSGATTASPDGTASPPAASPGAISVVTVVPANTPSPAATATLAPATSTAAAPAPTAAPTSSTTAAPSTSGKPKAVAPSGKTPKGINLNTRD